MNKEGRWWIFLCKEILLISARSFTYLHFWNSFLAFFIKLYIVLQAKNLITTPLFVIALDRWKQFSNIDLPTLFPRILFLVKWPDQSHTLYSALAISFSFAALLPHTMSSLKWHLLLLLFCRIFPQLIVHKA